VIITTAADTDRQTQTHRMSINGSKLEDGFYSDAKDYWSGVEPTVKGMLGGFTRITSVDIKASTRFLSKYWQPLDKRNDLLERQQPAPTRALDCGSGIGRVTKHLLLKFFDTVDLLEQNDKFLTETKSYMGAEDYQRVGHQFNAGLQDFQPAPGVQYECIWCQWVTGHLTDEDFVQFHVRCKSALNPTNGVIVVKDNTTSSDECDADTTDSSVTRPHWLMLDIFKRAGLEVVCERKQYKMPKGLYPVYMFALK